MRHGRLPRAIGHVVFLSSALSRSSLLLTVGALLGLAESAFAQTTISFEDLGPDTVLSRCIGGGTLPTCAGGTVQNLYPGLTFYSGPNTIFAAGADVADSREVVVIQLPDPPLGTIALVPSTKAICAKARIGPANANCKAKVFVNFPTGTRSLSYRIVGGQVFQNQGADFTSVLTYRPFDGGPLSVDIVDFLSMWFVWQRTFNYAVFPAMRPISLELYPKSFAQVFHGLNEIGGIAIDEITLTAPALEMPDLTITNVRPVQVVYGADLVLNKSTKFEVTVHATKCASLPQQDIPLQITYDGAALPLETIPRALFSNAVAPDGTCDVRFHAGQGSGLANSFVPTQIGQKVVSAKVNPFQTISEQDFANNTSAPVMANVRPTVGLRVVYVPVGGCADPGVPCYQPAQPQTVIDANNRFIRTVYPLADSGLTASTYPNVAPAPGVIFEAPFLGSPIPGLGLAADLRDIAVWGRRSDPLATKFVGVVNGQTYFAYHHSPDTAGVSYPWFPLVSSSALINDVADASSAAAHEIGHLLGLHTSPFFAPLFEEYWSADPGNPASGFWVEGNRTIGTPPPSNVPAYCFMGLAGNGDPLVTLDRWVDTADYTTLIDTLQHGADPEAILVSAIIHDNLTVDVHRTYFLPNATVSEASPVGNYVIRLTDVTGAIVGEYHTDVTFARIIEGAGQAEAVDRVPFVFTVAFPPSATTLQILHNGQVLVQFAPHVRLLTDAVETIPPEGFWVNPDQSKQTLLGILNQVGQLLATGRNQEAIAKLHNDFGTALQTFVRDDFPVTPLIVSKGELTSLVETIENRISTIAPAPIVCDADRDQDIDLADLLLIRAANGQLAEAGDPRDGNGDGRINVADVRYCQLRMTIRQ